MKKIIVISLALSIFLQLFSQENSPESVKKDMKRVADWQIEHYSDNYSNRKEPHHPLAWTNAALYIGMVRWAEIAEDDTYWEWMKNIGEENEWQLHHRVYNADDHAVGQMYVSLYRKYGDEKMIEPTKKQLESIYYHPSTLSLEWESNHKYFKKDRWSWCDALFMGPPLWAQMYSITGDDLYLDFLMDEFKATTKFLFDKRESLYYRDERFKDQRDNGTKIFWSRGNGWVFAGLVAVMEEFEPDSKEYKYFLKIYKKMAARLIQIQTDKGHWAMSLLGDEFYPTPETSGTAFYTFGLAWGINQEILDREEYLPATMKAWNALTSYITKDGMLGYVQPIGAAPGKAWPDKTEVYGTGAFLSAGAEVYKLLGGK